MSQERAYNFGNRHRLKDQDENVGPTRETFEELYTGWPPLWAQTRNDLGETLDYMACYGQTLQTRGGVARGIILDIGLNPQIAYIGEEIIIATMGLGHKFDDRNGRLYLATNQTWNKWPTNTLPQAVMDKTPIPVFIGNRFELSGRPLPHRYNLMDLFVVVYLWSEKLNDKMITKVLLQKLDLSKKSWWAPKGSPPPPAERDYTIKPTSSKCLVCQKNYPQIFLEGHMCLNASCGEFWKINGEIPINHPNYHPPFLNYRVSYNVAEHMDMLNSEVAPQIPKFNDENWYDWTYGKFARRGLVCPMCHRCVPRVFWHGWKCHIDHKVEPAPYSYEKNCPWELRIPPRTFPTAGLQSPLVDDLESFMFTGGWGNRIKDSPIEPIFNTTTLAPYRIINYPIRAANMNIGTVMHFISNPQLNAEEHGPDHLYQSFQVNDLGLARSRFELARIPGQQIGQFAKNIGLPYYFGAVADSVPFLNAHPDEIRAFTRANWAIHKACEMWGGEYKMPNEALILGYVEGQDISYHSDGKIGAVLGPSIATVALGAPSRMLLRMRRNYYLGVSKRGVPIPDDPLLEGCANYEARAQLKMQYDHGEIDDDDYKRLRKEVFEKSSFSLTANAPDIIGIIMYHGNTVVMHGEDIQKYYEHSVDLIHANCGPRFAITVRHVKPETVSDPLELSKAQLPDIRHLEYHHPYTHKSSP